MTKQRKTIGVVGYGFVGEAVAKGLAPVADVIVYDKAKGWMEIRDGVVPMVCTGYGKIELDGSGRTADKPDGPGWEPIEHEDIGFVSLKEREDEPYTRLVQHCSIIFVCVPTPMKPTGECSTAIVDEVVMGLNRAFVRHIDGAERDEDIRDRPVVVIKSTVPPGTTARLQGECGWLDLVFNPEFLTEANPNQDFAEMDRVVLGGEGRGLKEVLSLYRAFNGQRKRTDALMNWMTTDPHNNFHRLCCSPTEAEMIKYLTNCFLATKVSLANEFAQVCDKVGADWETVWGIASADKRLGTSHWAVPNGDPPMHGFSGSCFPKDLNAMKVFMVDHGVMPLVLMAAWQTNLIVRPERDWEQLKGRAVE